MVEYRPLHLDLYGDLFVDFRFDEGAFRYAAICLLESSARLVSGSGRLSNVRQRRISAFAWYYGYCDGVYRTAHEVGVLLGVNRTTVRGYISTCIRGLRRSEALVSFIYKKDVDVERVRCLGGVYG